jgi:tetratricopeptide (TPR) repeat protein
LEKYQRHGINPLLISIATGQDVEHVSSRPTIAMLPGKYPKLIYKHLKTVNGEFPETIFRLTCAQCGKGGDYDLGTLVVPATVGEDEKRIEKIQALGYFRCKHCNTAGEWILSSRMRTMLAGKMVAAAALNVKNKQSDEVIFGEALIDNDFAPRWGSDAESYFLQKLVETPDNAYFWNRLGNTYYRGKRPELAAVAHEQALVKDMGQVESHFSLGQILFDCGEFEKAAEHLRQAVAFSHQYEHLPAYNLRELIVGALTILFAIYNKSDRKIDMLPKPGELEIAHFTKSEIAATAKLDFDIDPNRRETFYPLAEAYLGSRRIGLPPEKRSLLVRNSKANWPVASKVNKQKPSKKNKSRKKR